MTRHDEDLASARVVRDGVKNDGRRAPSPSIRSVLIAALAAFSAAALAGCEEQSYPTPSVEQAAPPAPAPPAALMGAPTPAPAPTPAGGPCGATPCGPSAPTAQAAPAPQVIASTPVPNPPEMETEPQHRHSHVWAPGRPNPVAPHHHAVQPSPEGPAPVVASAAPPRPRPAAAPTPSVIPPPAPATPHQPAPAPVAVAPTAPAATPPKAAVAPSPNTTAATGSTTSALSGADASRYASLQSALSNLIAIDAALATPDHFQANQSADVMLTLPADFAQQVRDEAAKAGLGHAVASVNIGVTLAGTGFNVKPGQPQTLPLLPGQPTVFHWTVTPTSAAAGPVKADVSADLLSAGHAMPLGSIQSQVAMNTLHMSARLIGVALLILVLVVGAGWLVSRGAKSPPFRRRDI